MTLWLFTAVLAWALPYSARAESLRCDLTQYKPSKGLTATIANGLLVVSWQGDRGRELRMRLTVSEGRPVIRDLAVRNAGAPWALLGENLAPEYHLVTGVRRMTTHPTAMRNGDSFVTTGEILIPAYKVEETGGKRSIVADVEWTFPLSFVEVVWGDGRKIDRQIVSATDLGAFGTKQFRIPFEAAGKAWVRFAVWDSAGNGAFVQPVWVR